MEFKTASVGRPFPINILPPISYKIFNIRKINPDFWHLTATHHIPASTMKFAGNLFWTTLWLIFAKSALADVTGIVYCETPVTQGALVSYCGASQTYSYFPNSLGFAALDDGAGVEVSEWDSLYVSVAMTLLTLTTSVRPVLLLGGTGCAQMLGVCESTLSPYSATISQYTIYAPTGGVTTEIQHVTVTNTTTVETTSINTVTSTFVQTVAENNTETSVSTLHVTDTSIITSVSVVYITNNVTETSISTIVVVDSDYVTNTDTYLATLTVTNTTTVTDTSFETSTVVDTVTVNATVTDTLLSTVTASAESPDCSAAGTVTVTTRVTYNIGPSGLLTIFTSGDTPASSTLSTCFS